MSSLGVLVVLLLAAAAVWLEVPPLVSQRLWGELIAFSVLMIIGVLLGTAAVIGLPIPTPSKIIESLVGPIAVRLLR